jgi:Zn-dependent M28 family amino/carboxypeptidase
MKPFIALLGACTVLAACGSMPSAPSAADVQAALASINADDIMRRIRVLASDEFEGRAPGSRGEALTVAYLVDEFRQMGLRPGNPNGTYVQLVPFVGTRETTELSFEVGGQTIALNTPRDYTAGSPRQVPQVEVRDSEIVFVGYGGVAPEYGWDDFKGFDVTGKTLLTLINDPQVPDPADPTRLDETLFKGRGVTVHARADRKREVAGQRGAAARIVLFEPGTFGVPAWKDRISDFGTEEFDTQRADRRQTDLAVSAELSPAAASRLLAASGHDLQALKQAAARKDFTPMPLGAKASFRVTRSMRTLDSHNVVARVEGSDPVLKHETIIYTAHWDHFGRDPTLAGDQIFNGARDNASGVAAMLEVAKAFARMKVAPRRSILFIATTGEEHGLLGAKYYIEHPLYPLERTLAVLNTDIVNVWGPTRDVSVIGYGKSTLADVLVALANASGREATDDLLPELGLFYRSDHYEFSRQGVPSVWLRRGQNFIGKPADWGRKETAAYLANDYHKVSDEIKPGWDLSGAVEDLKLYFQLGLQVAQAADWPQWKPGDEFKAKRDEMLKRRAR